MYLIIWEYRVQENRVNDFERVYNPDGAWAELFKKSRGFLGTELLRDEENLQRCVTIDRWDTKEDYESFLYAVGKGIQGVGRAVRRFDRERVVFGEMGLRQVSR